MTQKLNISGVLPHLSVSTGNHPFRSESGIGALLSWANKLWMVSYVAHTGTGAGLYSIDQDLNIQKHPQSVSGGTFANRMIHSSSDRIIIGPHLIDEKGKVETISSLKNHRLAAVMEHLSDPENKLYFLTMEGLFLETDLNTFKTKQLFDLNHELGITDSSQIDFKKNPELVPTGKDIEKVPQPHFKAAHTGAGRVVVANNTFGQMDFLGLHRGGRLAEWDGGNWKIIEEKPFNEVAGRRNWNQVVFATGWDRASAILKVLIEDKWQTYRLPKGSHCFEHFWQTEWPRIREVETERYMMDASGILYELSPVPFDNKIWGIKPICSHLRIIPDYCSYKGMLVMAGNQTTPIFDNNLIAGYPESNLWFGKTDDLWNWGRPAGWGGVWWQEQIKADENSDPYLMTGFDKKVLHLTHNQNKTIDFQIEVDFLGTQDWHVYETISVPSKGYIHHEFARGYSAHWVRIKASSDCIGSAYFTYT